MENVVRPHPYLDAPRIVHENADEEIPPLTLEELIGNVFGKKMKKSRDSYGLNNFMFKFIDASHWILLLDLYNRSFASAFVPDSWKGTRMLLLAKKNRSARPANAANLVTRLVPKDW